MDYTGFGGGITKNETSKYDVSSLTYPDDLFSQDSADRYGNSWAMFNVNVQSISSMESSNPTVELDTQELAKSRIVQTVNRESARQDSVGGATAKASAAAGGLSIFKDVVSGGSPSVDGAADSLAKGLKVATATSFFAGAPLFAAGQATRNTKRLKAAIQLPMPNMLLTNYVLNWGTTDTMMWDLMQRGFNTVGDSLISSSDKYRGNKDLAAGAVLGISKFMDMGAISVASGLAANTKMEQIFQGVNFRSFALDYHFFPRDEREAQIIRNIVYMFKYHAAPEFLDNYTRMNFVYPSEFDISFFTNQGFENEYVNRIASCILNQVTVNYTPTNVWASHDKGIPAMIRMTLQFTELGILTKDAISKGY